MISRERNTRNFTLISYYEIINSTISSLLLEINIKFHLWLKKRWSRAIDVDIFMQGKKM